MVRQMFIVFQTTAYDQEGELSAAVELRRLFPSISGNAEAWTCARTVVGRRPLPAKPPRPARADAPHVALYEAQRHAQVAQDQAEALWRANAARRGKGVPEPLQAALRGE